MGSGSVVGEEVVGRLLVLVSLSGRVMERVWGRLGAVGGRGGGEGVGGSGLVWGRAGVVWHRHSCDSRVG